MLLPFVGTEKECTERLCQHCGGTSRVPLCDIHQDRSHYQYEDHETSTWTHYDVPCA